MIGTGAIRPTAKKANGLWRGHPLPATRSALQSRMRGPKSSNRKTASRLQPDGKPLLVVLLADGEPKQLALHLDQAGIVRLSARLRRSTRLTGSVCTNRYSAAVDQAARGCAIRER